MSKDQKIAVLKTAQLYYANKLAAHATVHTPTAFQQSLQDRLFVCYDRVTAQLAALL